MKKYILSFDPSGNYKEGKGSTGWVLLDPDNVVRKHGVIAAKYFDSAVEYWDAHIDLIDELTGFNPDIVIEDYRLYHNRAVNQINSLLETPRLIGVLTYECYKRNLKVTLQPASAVKSRWKDDILVKKKYIVKKGKSYYLPKEETILLEHVRDALRHAIHYRTFNKGDK